MHLNQVLAESLELIAAQAAEQGVAVERDLTAGLPAVSGSANALRQVALNLLTNALNAMPGGGRLRCSTRPARGNAALEVRVADTGPGIAPEHQGRLFEPFERLDNPVSRDVGGTGLGLAISKKFVELHGGQMWAESRENAGSTFHFTLPCVAVPVH